MLWFVRIGTKQKPMVGRGDTFPKPCNSWDLWEIFEINPDILNALADGDSQAQWSEVREIFPRRCHRLPPFWGSQTLEVRRWNVRGVAVGECEDDCRISWTCTSEGTLQNIERLMIALGVVIVCYSLVLFIVLLLFVVCCCPWRHCCCGGCCGGGGGYRGRGRCGCCCWSCCCLDIEANRCFLIPFWVELISGSDC